MRRRVLLCAAALFAAPVVADHNDELEQLLEIGDEQFVALTEAPPHPPFIHQKTLTLGPEAMSSGWVRNEQCHRQFSPAAALQFVFKRDQIRAIEILEQHAIGRSWVDGNTVQLEDVGKQSSICFRSENRMLERQAGGGYRIKVGPFFYRFLDGYFPVQVDLKVRFPADKLVLSRVRPESGVEVERRKDEVRLSSTFQGILRVEMLFDPVVN